MTTPTNTRPQGGAEAAFDNLKLELRSIINGRPIDAATKAQRCLYWVENIESALAAPASAQEAEEDAFVIERLSSLLAGVAIALKGEEKPRRRHSYHDLVELAQTMKLELDLYRAVFPNGVPESALAATSSPSAAVQQGEVRLHQAAQSAYELLSKVGGISDADYGVVTELAAALASAQPKTGERD